MFKAIGYIALGTLITVLKGYVFKAMWAWFVVPTFGAPVISVPVAIGLAYIVGLLTADVTLQREEGKELVNLISALVVVLMFWGCAAIVHQFV